MDRDNNSIRKLGLALLVAGGMATGTARAQPVYCQFSCGECLIMYYACESCSGSGCGTTGWNCEGACWDCGDDSGCAS